MAEPSPYEVLGVSPRATTSEIRSAFRKKVRASHPDTTVAGDEGDVIAVVEAFRLLMDRTAVGDTAGNAEAPVSRRVEVRSTRDREVTSPTPRPCSGCRGTGVIETRARCAACRGSGTITRLEANHADVVACRRCRGRGESRAHEACSACGGSGSITRCSR